MKLAPVCGMALILALIALSGCAGSGNFVVSVAAESEFGAGVSSCEDTIAVAAVCGIDYVATVEMAFEHDAALTRLFWLSAHGGFDAASSQGHASVMGAMLRLVGDRRFSRVLAKSDAEIHESVLEDLRYDYGCCDSPWFEGALRLSFPRTFAS